MWACLHSSVPGSDQVWLIKKVNGKQVYCWHKKVTVSGMSCVLQGYSLYPTSFILLSTISSYLLPLFCSSLHLHCCSSLCSSLHLCCYHLSPSFFWCALFRSLQCGGQNGRRRWQEWENVYVCACVYLYVCVAEMKPQFWDLHKFLGITLKVDLDSKLKRLDFDSHYFDQTWLKLTNLP